MQIVYLGKKIINSQSLSEVRDYYLISHKGKTIDYAPENGQTFKQVWRKSIRNCVIRTLNKKCKYTGIIA